MNLSSAYGGVFKVTRVIDGDPFVASGHDAIVKVRLDCVDAPELMRGERSPGQPFSQTAKDHLEKLVLDKSVNLKAYGLGGFNRPLCEVFIDNSNVNLAMINSGLAEVYRGKKQKGFNLGPYLKAEAKAKASKMGVWSVSDYESPRAYRKKRRKK